MKIIREYSYNNNHCKCKIETDGEIYKVTLLSDYVYGYPEVKIFENVEKLNNWLDDNSRFNEIERIKIETPINDSCKFLNVMFDFLLSSYTTGYYDMTWSEFLEQVKKETIQEIEKWKDLEEDE